MAPTSTLRIAIPALLAASALAGGASLARAQDGVRGAMCARGAASTAIPAGLLEARVVEEAAETDVPSIDAAAAAQRDRLAAREAWGVGDDILWCASADDPRCVPARHDVGGGVRLRLGGFVFVMPIAPPSGVPSAGSEAVRFPVEVLRGAVGVRDAPYRPPRT
jgi:hypothetical protein